MGDPAHGHGFSVEMHGMRAYDPDSARKIREDGPRHCTGCGRKVNQVHYNTGNGFGLFVVTSPLFFIRISILFKRYPVYRHDFMLNKLARTFFV